MDLMLTDDDWLVGWLDDQFERLQYFIVDALGILYLPKKMHHLVFWLKYHVATLLRSLQCFPSFPSSRRCRSSRRPGILKVFSHQMAHFGFDHFPKTNQFLGLVLLIFVNIDLYFEGPICHKATQKSTS